MQLGKRGGFGMADAESVKKSRELVNRFLSALEKAGVEVKRSNLAPAKVIPAS